MGPASSVALVTNQYCSRLLGEEEEQWDRVTPKWSFLLLPFPWATPCLFLVSWPLLDALDPRCLSVARGAGGRPAIRGPSGTGWPGRGLPHGVGAQPALPSGYGGICGRPALAFG